MVCLPSLAIPHFLKRMAAPSKQAAALKKAYHSAHVYHVIHVSCGLLSQKFPYLNWSDVLYNSFTRFDCSFENTLCVLCRMDF